MTLHTPVFSSFLFLGFFLASTWVMTCIQSGLQHSGEQGGDDVHILLSFQLLLQFCSFSSFCFQMCNVKVSGVVVLKLVGCRSPFYSLTHWESQIAIHTYWHNGKESTCSGGDSGDVGLIPWGGNDNPLQYSCLENPMDGGGWWAIVHGVTKESNMTE